jgi:hypothetical protein
MEEGLKISIGELKRFLDYNPKTGVWIWIDRPSGRGQRPQLIGAQAGSVSPKKPRSIMVVGKLYSSSILAWFYMTGGWPKKLIDHKNGDCQDDRWKNLRLATRGQNKMNSRVHKTSKLGVKGVFMFNGKFRAQLKAGGRRRFVKDFDTLNEARLAYAQAAKKYHGEFART